MKMLAYKNLTTGNILNNIAIAINICQKCYIRQGKLLDTSELE
jgi:hypothetical protein